MHATFIDGPLIANYKKKGISTFYFDKGFKRTVSV